MKVLDTCFLIDLQRELKQGQPGAAMHFLERKAGEVFGIATVSVTEFLEGFANMGEGENHLRPFLWLDLDGRRARAAARIRRDLRQKGKLIGDFDILIAATALAEEASLVTNNTEHFRRIDGLRLEAY